MLNGMSALAAGQRDQPRTVEVDAIAVDEIWIFVRILDAGAEPDLPLVFVNVFDEADDIRPTCDLILEFPCAGINKVEVSPAVPFGHMDDLVSPIQVIHEVQAEVFLVIGPDEGPGLLVDKVAGGTRTRVDFDEPEALVAAVHLLVGDAAAVFGPTQARNAEIDWLHGGFEL